jgi:acyl-CoA synthetase (AMP-forming)/AMP-acid ligase II
VLTVELLRRGAARHARRTAVTCGDQSLTFSEVDAAANRIAHVLAGLGVARGGRVGLLIGNGLWSIPVDFGCVKAGAVRVPLNVRLAADEQARMLAATGVRLLVHDVAQAGRAGELASQVDGLRLASLGPAPQAGALDLLAEMGQASDADPRVPAEADDPVQVIDAIPLSPVGKVLRRALRDPLWSRPTQ